MTQSSLTKLRVAFRYSAGLEQWRCVEVDSEDKVTGPPSQRAPSHMDIFVAILLALYAVRYREEIASADLSHEAHLQDLYPVCICYTRCALRAGPCEAYHGTQLIAGPWQDRGVIFEHLFAYVFNNLRTKNKTFYN